MKRSPKNPDPALRGIAAQTDGAGHPHQNARTPAGGLGPEVHAYDSSPVSAPGGGTLQPSPGAICADVEIVGPPGVAEQFSQARLFHQMARLSAAQSVAFMILCGHELNRLHKELGFERGGARRGAAFQSANVCTLKFDELAEQFAGVSRRTAYNYRQMATEARKRIAELSVDELLNTPLNQLPQPRQETLLKAVHKATDGQTAQQLMFDWGLAKGAPGARGRKPGDGGRPSRGHLSVAEQAEIMREAAHRDWVQIHDTLAYYGHSFTRLDDTEIEIQLALLRAAVKARQTWLKERAPHNRNLDAVKAILAEAN